MYSLIAIFLFVPLYFSHVFSDFWRIIWESLSLAPLHFLHIFSDFWWIIWESLSFERQKVYFFLILILFAIIESMMSHGTRIIEYVRRYSLVLLLLGTLPGVGWILHQDLVGGNWLWWSWQKHHGYLFWIGCITLSVLIAVLSSEQKRKLIRTSITSAILVAVFALGEYTGIYEFLPGASGTWESGRSISTLGNPNYVAGYLLIHIALVWYIRSPEKWIAMGILILWIMTTKSMIAMFLWGVFALSLLLKLFIHNRWRRIATIIGCTILLIIAWYSMIPAEKLLSLESRWILMRDIWTYMVQHPFDMLVWHGPESIIGLFSMYPSLDIARYFPQGSIIDSSHNILLDIVYQFGIIPLLFIFSWIRIRGVGGNSHSQAWALLGILFLMMNPYVLVHITSLILCLNTLWHTPPPSK